MLNRLALALGAAAAVMFWEIAPAHAGGAPTARHVSAGGLVGYGFKDGLNLGLGVRGGYTLPTNLYLGATLVYHLGKSQDTGFGNATNRVYYFGVEGGYDIAAGPVVIRPYLGVGAAIAKVYVPGPPNIRGFDTPGSSVSDGRLCVWPGATLLYPIGPAFIGGDARFLIVDDFSAFSLLATGGIQF